MSPSRLDVLIVTRDRPDRLGRLLDDLQRQDLPPDLFRVLISDDGSEPPLDQQFQANRRPFACLWFHGPSSGPATARNRALPYIEAPVLLFLNDDVRLAPDTLSTHLELHRSSSHPTAWMGTFDFTEAILQQPLNRLAQEMGLFGTSHIPAGVPLGPLAFCTGHLSLPSAEVLAVGGFDPSFPEPAGEDLDLGYRLMRQRGLGLMLSTRAQAWHDHPHDFRTWWDRWHLWGRALRRLAEKHLDPLFWPGGRASLTPENRRSALARVLAQEPLALELMGWLERLSADEAPAGTIRVEGLQQDFQLPEDTETLMRIGLNTSMFVIQRAFWQAGIESDGMTPSP